MLGGTVYIGGEPLDSVLLSRVSVRQAINEHWWCEIDFRQTAEIQPPCEEVLGKRLRVVAIGEDGAQVDVFSGLIVEAQRGFEVWGSSNNRLKAATLSYLLDLTPRNAYYLRRTPGDISQAIVSAAGLDWAGQLGGAPLSYVQQGETDFSFVRRLVDDDEKWLRPTAGGLETLDSFAGGVTLSWRGEHGLHEFGVTGRKVAKSFSGCHYDYRSMQSQTVDRVADAASTLGSAGRMWSAVDAAAQAAPESFAVSRARLLGVDQLQARVEKESRRSLSNGVLCRGLSLDPRLKAGDKVGIEANLDARGSYGLLTVEHVWAAAGYENRFTCTPAAKYTPRVQPAGTWANGVYRARVADNNDPEGLGRLRIQFLWQEDSQSCWARSMAPYAGAGYGIFVLPELGDEVWVLFEEGDPERPRVIGSSWNGMQKPPREELWCGDVASNDVKRLVTKSGHRITLSDKPGQNAIVIATPEHVKLQMIEGSNETGDSMLALHSDGDLILSAPNGRIHFHAGEFSREVGGGGAAANLTESNASRSVHPVIPISATPKPLPLNLTCTQKMASAIHKAPLGQGVLDALGGPTGIATGIAAMAAVWGLSQLTPAGWAADIAGMLLVAGIALSGSQIIDGLQGLYRFWEVACKEATTEVDLDRAGLLFADSVAKVGVNVILILLNAKALRRLTASPATGAPVVGSAKDPQLEPGTSPASTSAAPTPDEQSIVEPNPAAPKKPTPTDRLKEHLTDRDLDAARREAKGEIVSRKADGTPWDHQDEVRNAQRGLLNRIGQIKRRLGHPGLSDAERQELTEELSQASLLLDRSEGYLQR